MQLIKRQEKIQGLDQFKTMLSLANKQDLLGTMPVLLVLILLPFLQPVCFDKHRTVPQRSKRTMMHKKKAKINTGSQSSNIFLAKSDSMKKLTLFLLSSGSRYTFA